MKKITGIIAIICMFFISVNAGAVAGVWNKLDSKMIDKVNHFLVEKSMDRLNAVEGEEHAMTKGHLLSLKAVEKKTGKEFLVEIVTTTDFTNFVLLDCKPLVPEDAAKK